MRGLGSACRRGLCRLCFPLAGARQSRYHGDKHSPQTKTRDDSVMLKYAVAIDLASISVRLMLKGRVAPAGSLVVCRELHVD